MFLLREDVSHLATRLTDNYLDQTFADELITACRVRNFH